MEGQHLLRLLVAALVVFCLVLDGLHAAKATSTTTATTTKKLSKTTTSSNTTDEGTDSTDDYDGEMNSTKETLQDNCVKAMYKLNASLQIPTGGEFAVVPVEDDELQQEFGLDKLHFFDFSWQPTSNTSWVGVGQRSDGLLTLNLVGNDSSRYNLSIRYTVDDEEPRLIKETKCFMEQRELDCKGEEYGIGFVDNKTWSDCRTLADTIILYGIPPVPFNWWILLYVGIGVLVLVIIVVIIIIVCCVKRKRKRQAAERDAERAEKSKKKKKSAPASSESGEEEEQKSSSEAAESSPPAPKGHVPLIE